jgi:chemotaxis protein methyltransferase WspC
MWSAKIEDVLRDAMGLDARSIGSSTVRRAVQDRCAACGGVDLRAYWQKVSTSADELQELIESVVVPETWFFRDRAAFNELARIAHEEWRRTLAVRSVRLLSLPCSTGEEPYSMAMTMLEAGYTANQFAIDGVDISRRSLATARRAIYGKNAFRGTDLNFRDRHFQNTGHGYRLHDAVRESVRFRHDNIRADGFLSDVEPYDAIFCRNLLIYFDEEVQQRAIAVVQRLLSSTGVLFVGPAEANVVLHADFVSARVPLAFAFRRSSATAAVAAELPAPASPSKKTSRAAARSKKTANVAPRTAQPRTQTPANAPPVAPSTADLDRAFALADEGQLSEAAALCEADLQARGPSSRAYYLMGLICSADGFLSAANRYYRKALYLDKNHHEALLHLALLLEQQGDEREAKVLRRRAQRL